MVHKLIRKIFGRRPTIGLALGGGGAAGFAHIGVIKVLMENDIPIDYVAGSSAGAIVGAYYSLYKEVNSLEKVVTAMTKRQILGLFGLNKPKFSLFSDNRFETFLTGLLDEKDFSDLKIPMAITAVDLERSEEVIFVKGNLVDAVMASISVPGFFPVRRINKRLLVDGGILNPVPINIVKQMGADIVIAVDLSYPDKIKLKNLNSISVISRTLDIFMKQSMELRNKDLSRTSIIRPRFKENASSVNIFRAKEYIKIGERAAKEMLPEINKLRRRFRKFG